MDALLDQLGLNNTFYIELGLIAVIFVAVSNIYFRPFLKLFEIRHKRTVEDREAAERLMLQANSKLEEYKRVLAEERALARKEYEISLVEAKKQESLILAAAREEAKKLTQEAADSVKQQSQILKIQIESEVEALAKGISDRLLSRKV